MDSNEKDAKMSYVEGKTIEIFHKGTKQCAFFIMATYKIPATISWFFLNLLHDQNVSSTHPAIAT